MTDNEDQARRKDDARPNEQLQWGKRDALRTGYRKAPAAAPAVPAVDALTDERIAAIARKAYAEGRLVWAGFSKDENGSCTVPVLSKMHFELARAVQAELAGGSSNSSSHLAHPADAGAVAVEQAIPMILHCPKCGLQHIDAPDVFEPQGACACAGPDQCESCFVNEQAYQEWVSDGPWTNPPHRSHLCHGCNHIWRPADVPTEGVRAIETRGKADSPASSQPQATPLEATSEQMGGAQVAKAEPPIQELCEKAKALCHWVGELKPGQRWIGTIHYGYLMSTMSVVKELVEKVEAFPAATATERAAAPADLGDYTALRDLAFRTLWLAYVWNDHNFKAAHVEAREICEQLGIHSRDEANAWIEKMDSIDAPGAAEGEATSERKPLTESEIVDMALASALNNSRLSTVFDFVRAIEQHRGIGGDK